MYRVFGKNVLIFAKKSTKTSKIFFSQSCCAKKCEKLFKNADYSLISVRYSSQYGNSVFQYITECRATEFAKNLLVSAHEVSGLPWWATVVCTTLFFRGCITLPLAAYQHYILAKVENLRLIDMPEAVNEVKREVALRARMNHYNDRQAYNDFKRTMKKRWDDLVIKENCHPFKATVTVYFQLPAWIFFSAALRNMAYMLPTKDAAAQLLQLQLAFGGFLWIPNLIEPDGLLILPLVLGVTNLAIIELQVLRRIQEPTRFQRYVTNFFRCVAFALVPISASVPSVLCLYWTTSSIAGLSQNLLLMSNRFRTFCGIPDTPTTVENPYLQLSNDLKHKAKSVGNMFTKNK